MYALAYRCLQGGTVRRPPWVCPDSRAVLRRASDDCGAPGAATGSFPAPRGISTGKGVTVSSGNRRHPWATDATPGKKGTFCFFPGRCLVSVGQPGTDRSRVGRDAPLPRARHTLWQRAPAEAHRRSPGPGVQPPSPWAPPAGLKKQDVPFFSTTSRSAGASKTFRQTSLTRSEKIKFQRCDPFARLAVTFRSRLASGNQANRTGGGRNTTGTTPKKAECPLFSGHLDRPGRLPQTRPIRLAIPARGRLRTLLPNPHSHAYPRSRPIGA